ncbi:MAG: tetratricopeptide repeat protein [Phycisphaerales bacterium]|nr:tetratricopeptide repeat protein [Phycisphaerales bacterium]
MGKKGEQPAAETDAPAVRPDPVEQVRSRWRELWQIPALAGAVALLAAGLSYGLATKPDPDFGPVLRSAESMLEREEYREAIRLLNEQVLPYVGRPEMSGKVEARFHQLIARAVYGGQKAIGIRHEENYRNALTEMRLAETGGADLNAPDQYLIADCYLALGEPDSAMARVEQIPADRPDLRLRIARAVIDRHMRVSPPRYEDAGKLLTDMLALPNLALDDRAWAEGQRARLDIAQGFSDAAINRLLRAMPRLTSASKESLGALHMLLGEAYLMSMATEEAALQLEIAKGLIPQGGIEEGRLQLFLAQVAEQKDDYERVRDLYLRILERFQPDEIRARAQLGLALAEARLNDHVSAQQVLGDLVAQVRAKEEAAIGLRNQILSELLSLFREQFSQEGVDICYRYAELAGALYAIEEAPPSVLEAQALAHRALADRIAESAPKVDGPLGPEMDAGTEREVQRHRIQAATYFRLHAQEFILTDLRTYADSLWESANLYDQGGDQREAANVFRQFAADLETDARQPEARFRLAQALCSQGRYADAITVFRSLIDDRDRGVNHSGIGRFADLSHVPLAQVYLLDGDPGNDEQAEMLLERAVSGDLGGPEAQTFLPAQTALGDLRLRRREFARAIESYEQVMARSDQGMVKPSLQFKLAEAYRLNARAIAERLSGSLTDAERRTLETTRQEHLQKALGFYDAARLGLEGMQPQKRSAMDTLYLRNAHFYLGDCAFDLGDNDGAVRYYNAARERYPKDPASLVALVQIVNTYLRQGNVSAARAANERAKYFYESLPEEVWDDPNLPMSRRDWERWIESNSKLYAEKPGG